MPGLQFMSELLATFDVELAGGENGNVFYHDGTFRDPKIRDATFIQRSAEFIHFNRVGGEEKQRFAFRFVGDSANGDAPLASFQTERADDLLLDYLVRHHFAADLGKTRKPSFDVKKAVFVQPADIACL